MSVKKVGLITGGVAVLLMGTAIVAPSFVDWNKYKPLIQSKIEDATGYDVNFGGNLDLAVLPFPHLIVEDLGITVPAEGGRDAVSLLTLKRAEVSVALMPLLSKRVEISSVNLVDPVIRLHVAKDGTQTWMTPKLSAGKKDGANDVAPANAPKAEQNIALDNLKIENGTFIYADARTANDITVSGIDTRVKAESLSGPFEVECDFNWNNQTIQVNAKTGRMEAGANALAMQASIGLPASKSKATFSGVVAMGATPEIQGDAGVETPDLSALMQSVTGNGNATLAKPVNVRGMLTASAESAALKTAQFSFGDLAASGGASITNIGGKNNTPMDVKITLNSTVDVNLDSFMVSGASAGKSNGKGGAAKKEKSFIPDTLALPMDVTARIDGEFSSISFKKTKLNNVKLAVEKDGASFKIVDQSADLPGGGAVKTSAALNYGTSTRTEKGGIVYSNPVLSYNADIAAQKPATIISAFVSDDALKSMGALLKDSLSLQAQGAVTPVKASVENGSLSLGKTSMNFSGTSYALDNAGKDNVVIALRSDGLNIDNFIARNVKAESNAVAPAPATGASKPMEAVIRETVEKLNLPVDISINAVLENVTMRGVAYNAIRVNGALDNNALNVKSASLEDQDGNAMSIQGTVRDLKNLAGLDLVLGGKTRDTEAMLKSFAIDTAKLPKNFGPLDLSVALNGEKPESLNFTANAKAMEGELQASGNVVNALTKPDVDKISLRVLHPNFEKLAQRFVPSYRAGVGLKKDLDAYANINLDNGAYDVSGIKVNLGSMALTGTVRADMKAAKPDITGKIQAGTVPLDQFMGKAPSSSGSSVGAKTSAPTGDLRWSRNAINTSWMHAYNLDLGVTAKTITYGNWVLDNADLGLTLKDGTLNIAKMNAGVQGGSMALSGTVKSSGQERQPIAVDVKADFIDVALEQLASGFTGSKPIKAKGAASLNVAVKTTGLSPAALVSDLNGQGALKGADVVLEGFDLAAMSRSLVSTTKVADNISGFLGGAMKGGQTSFDTIDGPFTIAEGIVRYDNFVMTGPAAVITNVGQVNLPLWMIDMTSTIDLVEPEDAPNLPVRFQGPLDKPCNTFANSALESYVGARVNQKLQKIIGDNVGDDALRGVIGGLLGGTTQQTKTGPTAAPQPDVAPAVGNDAPNDAPQTESQPEQKQMSPEEELIRGVLGGVLGGR